MSSQSHQASAGALLCNRSHPRSKLSLHLKRLMNPTVTLTLTKFLAAQHGRSRSSITVPTPGTDLCEPRVCWRLNSPAGSQGTETRLMLVKQQQQQPQIPRAPLRGCPPASWAQG